MEYYGDRKMMVKAMGGNSSYHGDGPSYNASRVVPRNLTGFAPGNWRPEKGLENLSAAADEGRTFDPNEDLSGRVHPEQIPATMYGTPATAYSPSHDGYPTAEKRGPEAVVMDHTGQITREIYSDQRTDPIYFDAVRLAQALGQIAHNWQQKAWRLETTLRSYRMATSDHDRAAIARDIEDIIRNLNV